MKANNIHYLGYRILGDVPARFTPLTTYIAKNLNSAGIRISPVVYVSSMTFWTITAIVIAAIVALPFVLSVNLLLNLNQSFLQSLVIALEGALIVGVVVLVTFIYFPRHIKGRIRASLNKNLIYIINYMAILAGSGVTNEEIFTSLSETGDVYKVTNSTKAIVRDIEMLGKDIVTAIDDESQSTPSKKYSRLLQGFIGTIGTGGDLKEYLSETAEHQMKVRDRELSGLVSSLDLAAQAYIVIGIAFPVILTTILSLMGVFGGEVIMGLNAVQVMMLMTYVIFPLASLAVIILIDGLMESW